MPLTEHRSRQVEASAVPVLHEHEAALEGAPPQVFLYTHLDGWRVHRQGEQDHAGDDGPVVVVNPPRPDAAAIHLYAACPSVTGLAMN